MIEYDSEGSYSEEQILDESNQILKEYIDNIDSQVSCINRKEEEFDFLKDFFLNFLNQENLDSVYDRSILIDPKFTDYDKNALKEITLRLDSIFEKGMGISLLEKEICKYYYLYDIFVLHFIMYFTIYLNGLQKLTQDWEEDIPNWNELSFKKYMEKNNPNDTRGAEAPLATIDNVDSYLDYILLDGVFAESFFEICLLESESNVALTELVVENANQRIIFDNEFFRLKIEKILSLEEVRSAIKTNFIETCFNNVGTNSV